ncbi:MAG: TetR/AcrR family transcriptional regulator [Limnobacter sp.]|uniref:TetR/AcrR family transcriptional regulator n=1 Tax=Limnobacter sp. TaxID=2003368 RepID=UPI00391DDCDC
MLGMKTAKQPKHLPEQSARERILHTAHDLFYGEGVRATGIDRIIEQAGVTKVTFYRHFPSKNDLIAAYLDYRHEHWMAWFCDALARTPGRAKFPLAPVVAAMKAWFNSPGYRGCAFINSVVELDGIGPWVAEVSQRHKGDMVNAIAALLPNNEQGKAVAQAAAMAVDGAIIRVQMEKKPEAALKTLELMLKALTPV